MAKTNFGVYRDLFENKLRTQSIEAEGLLEPVAYAAALADPRTTSIEISAHNQPVNIPLLTALEHATWFNLDYHQRYAGKDSRLTHYGHQSLLYERDPQGYLDALQPGLRQLANENGVLVLDHSDHEANHVMSQLGAIAGHAAVRLTPIAGPEGNETRHYHYASPTRPMSGDRRQAGQQTNIYDAYQAGRRGGLLPDEHVSVMAQLSQADQEQIWDFYEPVFAKLTHDDPVQAGFDEAEFSALMQSPDCIKFMYKEDDDVVNLFLLMDVKDCMWLNQYYFRDGQAYTSPGVIANPNLNRLSTSLRTMGMFAKVLRLSGMEPVLSFACDTASNKTVPGLSQIALTRAGIETDLKTPVGHQLFRMLRVSR